MADYISREAVLKCIDKDGYDNGYDLGYVPHNEAFKELIKTLPAADVVELKRGEWIFDSDELPVCSECGEIALQRIFVKMPHLIQDVRMVRSNFCPNCGAEMTGGQAHD